MRCIRYPIPRKRLRQAPPDRFRADLYAVGYFGPQHGLTPEQAWIADRLLAEKQAEHPLRGFRLALRIGGIVSAVKRGLLGNSRWGHSMLAKRGGLTLVRHAPDHLRRISELGVSVRQANAEMRGRYGKRYG